MGSYVNNQIIAKKIIENSLYDESIVSKILSEINPQQSLIGALAQEEGISKYPFLAEIADCFEMEFIKLKNLKIEDETLSLIPANFASHYTVMPLRLSADTLVVAVSDPLDITTLDDLSSYLNINIKPALAFESEIIESISRHYGLGAHTLHRIIDKTKEELDKNIATEENVENEEASIAVLVNTFLAEALRLSATDVHLEPLEDGLRARYRIDGVLQEVTLPEQIVRFYPSIVSRIKIMAHMDISEKRLPQDGRIQATIVADNVDIRVSTMPLVSGEAVHLRLLRQAEFLDLESLGFRQEHKELIDNYIRKPNGIILVTGPTGSGKSTTLYAALSRINTEHLKIITVEDPVEFNLPGINQIQVQPRIGLTFAEGLRHILRHDPDVMMVGEIRDKETAEIAIRSALTGHLVFSTLHTNDAASTVIRLLDMGFESYLLSTSLECVIAQRLVRSLCHYCKKEEQINPDDYKGTEFEKLKNIKKVYSAVGCSKCRSTGYQGRSVIAEILTVNENIRDLILANASSQEIKQAAVNNGMRTLFEDGLDKVIAGQTSLSEILRVIKED